MAAPFKTRVYRRQTLFFASALAFLSIYVFEIEINSLADIGWETSLKGEFVRTVLFWISMYSFLRYAHEAISELRFFSWHVEWREKAHIYYRQWTANALIIDLLTPQVTQRTVVDLLDKMRNRKFDGSTNRQFSNLSGYVHKLMGEFPSKLTVQQRQEKYKEAELVIGEYRGAALQEAITLYWRAWWKLLGNGTGWAVLLGHFIFDVIAPLLVFIIVVWVAYGAPEWVKYENLNWLWIKSP